MANDDKNVELNGADIFADWDKLVADTPTTPPQNADTLSLDNLMTDNGDAHWLNLFSQTNLAGMDLVALSLIPNYTHDFTSERNQLKTQSHLFLINLPNTHLNDLKIAGLSTDQIANLTLGILPINWTIHLKYPVAYGGAITPNNMVLMPHHPFHEKVHHFINQQTVTDAGIITPKTLYVPAPKSAVYVPFNTNEMPTQVMHFETIGGNK